MKTLDVPIYRPLSDSEKDDLVKVIKASREINEWFKVLQGCDDIELKEKVIVNILNQVRKIKGTNI